MFESSKTRKQSPGTPSRRTIREQDTVIGLQREELVIINYQLSIDSFPFPQKQIQPLAQALTHHACYLLFLICYLSFSVCYLLFLICYLSFRFVFYLFVPNYQLSIVNYQLPYPSFCPLSNLYPRANSPPVMRLLPAG